MTVMLIRRHLTRTTIASSATATTNPIVVVPEPDIESSSLPFETTACSTIQRDQLPSLHQEPEDQLQFLYEQEYSNRQREREQQQHRCVNYYSRGDLQRKREEPPPSSRRYQQKPPRQHPTTPFRNRKSHFSPTRAMRYYRVWIYTCNAVLFVCVIGFIIVASKIIIANPRRTLIPDFTLTHPSLLYAYFALIMQSGLIQLVGCLGARNLNEQLLNIYWYLLLAFLIGDVLLGAFWIVHFEYIVSQTRPALKQRFRTQYNNDLEFTQLWDMVQRDDHCCGVENYKDFYQNITMAVSTSAVDKDISVIPTAILPASCCGISFASQSTLPTTPMTTMTTEIKSPEARRNHVFLSTITSTVAAASISSTILPPLPPIFSTPETISVTDSIQTNGIAIRCSSRNEVFYTTGCEKRLLAWLRSSLDILFVLGYCVISFLKLCFVGILRYEIREMIQKIRILHNEQRNNIAEYPADSSLPSTTNKARQQVQVCRYERNGNAVGVTQSLIKSRSADRGSLYGGVGVSVRGDHDGDDENSVNDEEVDVDISATSPLLAVPTSTATVVSFTGGTAGAVVDIVDKKRSKSHENLCYQGSISASAARLSSSLANRRRYFHAFSADVANELDTNSHCALIMSDDTAADGGKDDGVVYCRHYSKMGRRRREKFANDAAYKYEIHELQELTRSQKSTATAASVTSAVASTSPAMISISSCSGGSVSSGGRNRNKI